MNLSCVLILVFCVTLVHSQTNCTFEHQSGVLEFPYFQCPDNSSCVVTTYGRRDGRKPFGLVPIGCCPDTLPNACYSNRTAYNSLLGCCPEDKSCCTAVSSGSRYLVGCVDEISQCCGEKICDEGYSCCRLGTTTTCCPDNTLCRSADLLVPGQPSEIGFRDTRLSSFFNISDDQLCIPMDTSVLGENETDTRPQEYPYIIEKFNLQDAGVSFFVVGVNESANVTECGTQMCYNDDTCIHRYRNISKIRVYKNITLPECQSARMLNATAWDIGCFRNVFDVETESYPAGCCAADKTPCGAHPHTFEEHPINAHASPCLYDQISGCVGENETCCHPYICPSGAKCCTAQRQVEGTDINMTELVVDLNGTAFATNNEGHNFCCPEDAYCCEYIPSHAGARTQSMEADSLPFCGTDATCTRNYFGGVSARYHARAVRETIPWTSTFFEDQLAFRTSIGMVGSIEHTVSDPNSLDETCFYSITPTGGGPIFFNIDCTVLGSSTSPAGAMYADNYAPYDQIVEEQRVGGIITCPSPTPEPWCQNP